METKRNNTGKTRGRPFQKGNPGRPKGARHKVTVAVENLLDGDAEALTRKAIKLALAGDMTAMRLCLDRVCPPRKERRLDLALPDINGAGDVVGAIAAVVAAVGQGEIAPGEGQALTAMIEAHRRAIETEDLERRIAALEKEQPR